MAPERWAVLPFTNVRPGEYRVRKMYVRNIAQLQNVVPNPQEMKRHQNCNAEVYAKHFSALSARVLEYGLDDERVWNLDESGCTPGKDTKENGPCAEVPTKMRMLENSST